ncbi:MAG: conserved phage C-terminal domain-containing protein [Limosilactobacillus pontis]
MLVYMKATALMTSEGYRQQDSRLGNDPKMSKYLRPETLFGTKMEGYVNEKSSNQSEGASVNKRRRYW